MPDIGTSELPRHDLLCALLWTAPDTELPAIMAELAEERPHRLLDVIDGTHALVDVNTGERHALARTLPPIQRQWVERLLDDDNSEIRQRAILALPRLIPPAESRTRTR